MTTKTTESCEQRIQAHQDGREEDFQALRDVLSNRHGEYDGEDIDDEQAIERLDEYPLGVSITRVMRVDLSTGGPGDWLEVELDDDGDVVTVTYHFNDWFDHAERRVHEGDALWFAAEYYAQGFQS